MPVTVIVTVISFAAFQAWGTANESGAASQGEGRWYCWSDAGLAHTVGYGTDCIWLGGSGLVWRYDRKQAKNEVFTPCDGLPLEQRVVTALEVAGDGTCVMNLEGPAAYLYRPGSGWEELPLPNGQQSWRQLLAGQ